MTGSIHISAPGLAARIPVEVWEGLTLLSCRVNDTGPYWFIFDTGATITVLDLDIAQQLQLDLGDRRTSARSGQATTWAHGLTLSMAGVALVDQTVVVQPVGDLARFIGHEVAGVFGYELLRHSVVEIDYAGGSMGIGDPGDVSTQPRGVRLPLAVVDKWPVIDVRLEQGGLPPVDSPIILDTGSLVPISLTAAGLAAATVELPVSAGITGVGAGNNRVGRLAALRFGPWTVADPPAVFPPAGPTGEPDYLTRAVAASGSGLIGAPILSRFRMTFDYPFAALWIEPCPGWDRPLAWDASGAVLMAADDTCQSCLVLGVTPGSAAVAAGLAVGDVIVGVDGQPVGSLTLPGIRNLLKQDGATVALEVRRGAEHLQVSLMLRRII